MIHVYIFQVNMSNLQASGDFNISCCVSYLMGSNKNKSNKVAKSYNVNFISRDIKRQHVIFLLCNIRTITYILQSKFHHAVYNLFMYVNVIIEKLGSIVTKDTSRIVITSQMHFRSTLYDMFMCAI